MHRAIDGHCFWDSSLGVGVVPIEFPSSLKFDERQRVWRIAVNLVGGHEDENSLRSKATRGFQQDGSAGGVDGEIRRWIIRGPIVGGLRCLVNDQRDFISVVREDLGNAFGVSNVQIVMTIRRN